MAKFYMMGVKCPRLKFFNHQDIEGVKQFRKIRSHIIKNFCVEILKGNVPPIINNDRIKSEIDTFNLIENLNQLKNRVSIESEIQWEDEIAYIGKIDGKNALFTLSISKRWSISNALSTIYIMDNISTPSNLIVATVMPIYKLKDQYIPKIRFYNQEGELTKKGELSKKDVSGTWDMIREKISKLMQKYDEFIVNTVEIPDPKFGECGICPYHNVEIEFGGKKYVCTG